VAGGETISSSREAFEAMMATLGRDVEAKGAL
jgi:hypothetical protein